MMNWYLQVWKRYADFAGRSRRKEYWYFTLFNWIIMMVLLIIGLVLGGRGSALGSVLMGLYFLAVIIPSLAVLVRRLHDTGRSGWWWLIGLIPFIGAIILLVFLVQDSQPGANQYGPNPKELMA